tara:strand:+ start:535 stop:906 length:372 start_codon:yes stop_codon:yes gene_type:complete
MNNINNLHKSPAFTILVIIVTFIGIVYSFQYSKYKNYLSNESFKLSSGISKKNYYKLNNVYRRVDLDYGSLKYSKYPIGSVPVKVVLGKIKKIENPYLPRLHLAFLDVGKNFISLNDHLALFD